VHSRECQGLLNGRGGIMQDELPTASLEEPVLHDEPADPARIDEIASFQIQKKLATVTVVPQHALEGPTIGSLLDAELSSDPEANELALLRYQLQLHQRTLAPVGVFGAPAL
jgi:hypothetical protein